MSDGHDTQKQASPSGISVSKGAKPEDFNIVGTVTLSRRSVGIGTQSNQPPPPQKTAAPPPSAIAKMPYSVATQKDVTCPKCQDRFDVSADYFNTVTQCLSCKVVFVIRPPGTAPYQPPASRPATIYAKPGSPSSPKPQAQPVQSTTSGIQVDSNAGDYGMTGTVLLSRSGMSMMQQKRGARRKKQQSSAVPTPHPPAAVAGVIYSVASDKDVGCPKCQERFEISPEFYEAIAECPDCNCEFVIKPPGTPPYNGNSSQRLPTPSAQQSPPQGRETPPQPATSAQTPQAPAPTQQPVYETPQPTAPSPKPQNPPATPTPAPQSTNAGASSSPPESKKTSPLILGLLVAVVVLLSVLIVILVMK